MEVMHVTLLVVKEFEGEETEMAYVVQAWHEHLQRGCHMASLYVYLVLLAKNVGCLRSIATFSQRMKRT